MISSSAAHPLEFADFSYVRETGVFRSANRADDGDRVGEQDSVLNALD